MEPLRSTCHACFRREAAFSRDVLLADAQEAQEKNPALVPEPESWMTFELCRPCASKLDRERARDRAQGRPLISRLAHLDDGSLSQSTLPTGD